jgi:hypothetical protein
MPQLRGNEPILGLNKIVNLTINPLGGGFSRGYCSFCSLVLCNFGKNHSAIVLQLHSMCNPNNEEVSCSM